MALSKSYYQGHFKSNVWTFNRLERSEREFQLRLILNNLINCIKLFIKYYAKTDFWKGDKTINHRQNTEVILFY